MTVVERTWRGLVFIGTSVDGYVARVDGTLDWLLERGQLAGDAGYASFMTKVDVILMGRGTYDVAAGFPEWPYARTPVLVLSSTLPPDADPRVEVVPTLAAAVDALNDRGIAGVYIDGARTVRSALDAGLVDEMTISQVAVLIGGGVPLFGALAHDIPLEHVATEVLGGGMVQSTYRIAHAGSAEAETPATTAHGWLPGDFVHPVRVSVADGIHIRPISADDIDIDMPAVMENQPMLWEKYGAAWGWPPATMTVEEDRADLARHAEEIEAHESFNYAILPDDESELWGCIYIDPADSPDGAPAAEVSWWVTAGAPASLLGQISEFVPAWLGAAWPFAVVAYPFRELD